MSRIGDAMKRAGSLRDDAFVGELTRDPAVPEAPAVESRPEAAERPADDAGAESGADRDVLAVEGSLLQAVVGHSEKLVANSQLQPVAVEQYRRLAAILYVGCRDRCC